MKKNRLCKKNKKDLIRHIINLRAFIKKLSLIIQEHKYHLKLAEHKITYLKKLNTYLLNMLQKRNKVKITYGNIKTKGKYYNKKKGTK